MLFCEIIQKERGIIFCGNIILVVVEPKGEGDNPVQVSRTKYSLVSNALVDILVEN